MQKKYKNSLKLFAVIMLLWLSAAGLVRLQKADPEVYNIQKLKEFVLSFESGIPKVIALIILFFVFRVLLGIIKTSISKVNKLFLRQARSKNFFKLINIAWRFLYVLVAVSIVFNNIGALITSLGLVGLGLTFALQKPILNAVGRLTIITKDLYSEGDRIKIGEIMGDVAQIQLMNTVLHGVSSETHTKTHKIITLSNELIFSQSIENLTKGSNYILDTIKISITYESDYHKAIKILEDIAKDTLKRIQKHIQEDPKTSKSLLETLYTNKGLFKKKKKQVAPVQQEKNDTDWVLQYIPKVHVELADSSIDLTVQSITPAAHLKENRSKIMISFLDAVKQTPDIEIAYPHMQIVQN